MSERILLELQKIENCPVRGHLKMLDDTRLVFVGENPEQPDSVYLGFRNDEGEDTKIHLSREAYEALKYLINEPFKGKRMPFPYTLSWQIQLTEQLVSQL